MFTFLKAEPIFLMTAEPTINAVAYVRMSTEHQQYSTDNQSDVIRAYAELRGFRIIKTFSDEGKSGLRIQGRISLERMLAEVQSGKAEFSVILVYDVSRWRRFQDWIRVATDAC